MPDSTNPPSFGRGDASFETTHWSVVLAAGTESPRTGVALETLCQTYWQPLYLYARRRVHEISEAQDLTQAFFVELLEKRVVSVATPDRGKFRAFLLTAFKHFLSKQWERQRALKRGGGKVALSLDFEEVDARFAVQENLTPEQAFDRQWAVSLLERVMQRLEAEFVAADKVEQFKVLKDFAVGDHPGLTYGAAGKQLGMSEGAAKMMAHRMRRRFRELLREEIVHTVSAADQVDDEIRNLFRVL